MLASFWDAELSITVPTNLVVAVMCLLVSLLLIRRLVIWKDKNPNVPWGSTPWSIWYPAALCLVVTAVFAIYGVGELLS